MKYSGITVTFSVALLSQFSCHRIQIYSSSNISNYKYVVIQAHNGHPVFNPKGIKYKYYLLIV